MHRSPVTPNTEVLSPERGVRLRESAPWWRGRGATSRQPDELCAIDDPDLGESTNIAPEDRVRFWTRHRTKLVAGKACAIAWLVTSPMLAVESADAFMQACTPDGEHVASVIPTMKALALIDIDISASDLLADDATKTQTVIVYAASTTINGITLVRDAAAGSPLLGAIFTVPGRWTWAGITAAIPDATDERMAAALHDHCPPPPEPKSPKRKDTIIGNDDDLGNIVRPDRTGQPAHK